MKILFLALFLISSCSTHKKAARSAASIEDRDNKDSSCHEVGLDCFDEGAKKCVSRGQVRAMSPSLLEDIKASIGGGEDKEIRDRIYPELVKKFLYEYARDPSVLGSNKSFTVVIYKCE